MVRAVPPARRRPAPSRRGPAPRHAVAAVLVAALALSSVACAGKLSRNDDHVGPGSPRPDAREHSMAPVAGLRPGSTHRR